jgi:hypothetical protein
VLPLSAVNRLLISEVDIGGWLEILVISRRLKEYEKMSAMGIKKEIVFGKPTRRIAEALHLTRSPLKEQSSPMITSPSFYYLALGLLPHESLSTFVK